MTPKGPMMGSATPPQDYNKTCQLTVSAAAGTLKASKAGAWTYSHRMTPEILKVTRGTQGMGHLEIYGSGFKKEATVEVGGAPCKIVGFADTKIDCLDATTPPEGAIVSVSIP